MFLPPPLLTSFLPLHTYLQGKHLHPSPGFPKSSMPGTISTHPHVTGLPQGSLACWVLLFPVSQQPIPRKAMSPQGVCLSRPVPSPLAPAPNSIALPAFASSSPSHQPCFLSHRERGSIIPAVSPQPLSPCKAHQPLCLQHRLPGDKTHPPFLPGNTARLELQFSLHLGPVI